MKLTKKVVSLILAVLILASCACVAGLSASATDGQLTSYYSTNKTGVGAKKSITVDGAISDWDSTMLIAQGTANDDPRVYCENSMHENPIDLYALYGAYDDSNLYLMWEMTNVQDMVASHLDYPLAQGHLYQTENVPFHIAIDTGKSSDAIGNSGQLQTGGTIWNSGISFTNPYNRHIAVSTNGSNGPYIYSGNSNGLNAKEIDTAATSGIVFKWGEGILSEKINGIDKGFGKNNGRIPGDICSDSSAWVEFNSKGHKSSKYDFHYEMSVPLTKLGITSNDISSNGIGVMVVATYGKSGMDSLPYDLSMNDNANKPDTESQAINSFEKSDEDNIIAPYARIGKAGGNTPIVVPTEPETEAETEAVTDEPTIEPTTAPQGREVLCGDSNGDKNITIKDATLIQKHIALLETIADENLAASDVNDDEQITIKDASAIQKYIAQLDGAYNTGKTITVNS